MNVHDLKPLTPELLYRCLEAAHLTQLGLARALGISARTMSRWLNGHAGLLIEHHAHALARAVFPGDPALAAEIAAMGGTTLEGLGLVKPRPPAAQQLAVAANHLPATTAPGPFAAVIDSVVCAALDQGDFIAREVRPLLAAAFNRAHELGLSMEEVARAFAEGARPATKGSRRPGLGAARVPPQRRLPPKR